MTDIPTLSLEQWARQEGRVCWADVSGAIHGGLRSMNQARKRSYLKLVERYRQEALATEREYRALVQMGLIREPREPSLEEIAQGHPDKESVQAARRVLEKRRQRVNQGAVPPPSLFVKEDV